ncbi:hypothetical protein ACFVR2_07615 [Gottfriedia sp. NPDC057991]|uniref:hypothetical protein n=1 Tax=Gottfriedia sp. NPDC057991 TaxID=3346298 RepID=UPI0036D761EE
MSNLYDDFFRESGFEERDFGNIFSKVTVPEDVHKNAEDEDFCKLNNYIDKSLFTREVYDKLIHNEVEYKLIDLSPRFGIDLIWAKWLLRKLKEINQKEYKII